MMNRRLALSLISAAVILGVHSPDVIGAEPDDFPSIGRIERHHPQFDSLIDPSARLQKLADGFTWVEGPVWVPKDGGYLLFSDTIENTIWKWQEPSGISTFLKPSGLANVTTPLLEPGTNGLTLDAEGRLVACDHGNRRIYRLEQDGKTRTTLVDRYQGKRLNSPNDLVFKSNGDLYFTDPPYGLTVKGSRGFPGQELDNCGVYRLSKEGELTLLTQELSRPNGLAFSPDEKTLYVANSDPDHAVWMAFDVEADGTLGKGRLFFDATPWAKAKQPGLPDGLKVDEHGNLFATGPGGLHVFSAEGVHLGTINTGVPTGNCAWGEDGSVLYVMADKSIGRIQTKTRRAK